VLTVAIVVLALGLAGFRLVQLSAKADSRERRIMLIIAVTFVVLVVVDRWV
jgi:hypothetical protein